jgi:hypothetical protein
MIGAAAHRLLAVGRRLPHDAIRRWVNAIRRAHLIGHVDFPARDGRRGRDRIVQFDANGQLKRQEQSFLGRVTRMFRRAHELWPVGRVRRVGSKRNYRDQTDQQAEFDEFPLSSRH